MTSSKNNKLSHGLKKTAVASVIALSLYGANSFAGFENYSFKNYGVRTTTFWLHYYYDNKTHTGLDFDVGKNEDHVPIYVHGFGKIDIANSS